MLNYLLGALLGGVVGLVSVFFAYGGLRQKKLFARLLKRKGRWHRSFALPCVLGAAIGIYAVWLYGSPGRNYWAMLLLSCYLLAVSVTDLRHRIIPDDCSAVFAVVFILFRVAGWTLGDVLTAAIGALLGAVILGLPHLLRPEAVGLGDVKLLAVCGLMVGFPGVVYLLIRAMLAMFLVSVVQLLRKKVNAKSELPMAPFVLFAALI